MGWGPRATCSQVKQGLQGRCQGSSAQDSGVPGQCPRPDPRLQGHDLGAWFFLSAPSASSPRTAQLPKAACGHCLRSPSQLPSCATPFDCPLVPWSSSRPSCALHITAPAAMGAQHPLLLPCLVSANVTTAHPVPHQKTRSHLLAFPSHRHFTCSVARSCSGSPCSPGPS